MKSYEKINTMFKRDMDTGKIIYGDWSQPEFEYLKDNIWVFDEKIDGCLMHNTKINTTDGKTLTIKEIVDNRMDISIYGMNREGEIVPSKILDWYNHGLTEDWLQIKYTRRGFASKGSSFATIKVTPNHKIFVSGKWIRADELKEGDELTFLTQTNSLSFIQKQILIGLLVGDGYLGENKGCLFFSHKKDHEEYIDYLLDSLGEIAGNKQTEQVSGYGTKMCRARTIGHHSIREFFQEWEKEGKKYIPQNIQLSPISLAILYLDDGSLSHSENQIDRANISLNDFNLESVNNFKSALENQMGIKSTIQINKGYSLRLDHNSANTFFSLICPYIPKCMQYKVPECFRKNCTQILSGKMSEDYNVIRKQRVLEINKITEKHEKYDITTSTSNFFANNVLVHNSCHRLMWDGFTLKLGGKTDNASIQTNVLEYFNKELLPLRDSFLIKFQDEPQNPVEPVQVCIYGEMIGKKIQKVGHLYNPDGVSFVAFDIKIGNWWLKREDVIDICDFLGIQCIPIIGKGTLQQGIDMVKSGFCSKWGDFLAEGIVARPEVTLIGRDGHRIITKIKSRDFY